MILMLLFVVNPKNEGTITLTYKNIISLVYYLQKSVKKWHEEESQSDTACIFREPYFFARPLCASFIGDWCSTISQPGPIWTGAQNGMMSSVTLLCYLTTDWLLTAQSWKLPLLYIFQMPMHSSHAIHMVLLLSFVSLKT